MKIRHLLLLLLTVAVLAVLFMLMQPVEPLERAGLPAEAADSSAGPEASANPVQAIQYNLTSGQAHVADQHKVQQGTPVTISVLSDSADELHLHGYDLHIEVPANTEATLQLVADQAGRFEMELHDSEVMLGVLEVMPR